MCVMCVHDCLTSNFLQHLEAMKAIDSLLGQTVALNNMAKTYEYMSNFSKATESLEAVSGQKIFILSISSTYYHLDMNMSN